MRSSFVTGFGESRPQNHYRDVVPCTELEHRRNRHTAGESAAFLEAGRVLQFASGVSGDEGKVRRWLGRPNRALADETPLQLLPTSTGRGLLRDVLGRIHYGVFA